MNGKTHILGGATAMMGILVASEYNLIQLPTFAVGQLALTGICCVVGSLFPDIDIQTSKMGKTAKTASLVISSKVGHRTLFHSPILYIITFFLLSYFFPAYQIFISIFTLGVLSHLFLDALNRAGIPLLYPYKKRFHILRIRTNSLGESLFAFFLVLILLGEFYLYFFTPHLF